MKARFQFPDRDPHPTKDSRIIDNASHLRLDCYFDMEGDAHFQYEISGTFGLASEGQTPEEFEQVQRNGFAFMLDLLTAMERKRGDVS